MNIIKTITFDGFCKRTTAAIGAFAAVLIGISIADGSALPFAARCFGVFGWGVCACAMLSLYFDMLGYALSAAGGNARRIFCVTDAAALALKLTFVLEPFSPADGNLLFLRFAALTADAFLSRAHMWYTRKRLDGILSDGC
ncbi:MAG: hypothetical protein HDR72_02485 [Ruminococcaceae bacterium]|nr:hypothetical protein [Oscillospiraceae bacterium]